MKIGSQVSIVDSEGVFLAKILAVGPYHVVVSTRYGGHMSIHISELEKTQKNPEKKDRQETVDKLLRMADFLENLPNKKFSFYFLIKEFDEANGCGTICCAVGWLPAIFPQEMSWNTEDPYLALEDADYWHTVDRFLGITSRESDRLFIPGDVTEGYSGLDGDSSSKAVAKHIRKCADLINNGYNVLNDGYFL